MKYIHLIFMTLVLISCSSKKNLSKVKLTNPNIGLMIIDAQKWYIPGHPESMYKLWNIDGHNRSSDEIIASMTSVLDWANANKLPIFLTFEAKDTGRYNLPDELLYKLDSSRTTKYVKKYYDATKHIEFQNLVLNSNIDHWVVIGAETDVCVYQTTKGLLKLGKQVTLVSNAIYSGRNDTKILEKNLELFGANFSPNVNHLSLFSLEHKSKKPIEKQIAFDDLILTIFPFDTISNHNKGVTKRLQNLKKIAEVTGIKIERFDSLSKNNATRVFAGNINNLNLENLKNTNDVIILGDAASYQDLNNIPKNWRVHTVKSFFYEMMETVDFYFAEPKSLPNWQQGFRKALDNEEVPYLESNQND